MSLLDNLPHRCTIFRVSRSTDAVGGSQYSVIVERTGVECWEQKASSSKIMEYQKRGIQVSTTIYFVVNPNLTERHRILITERCGVETENQDIYDPHNPDVLDVQSFSSPDDSVGLDILWSVVCSSSSGAQ